MLRLPTIVILSICITLTSTCQMLVPPELLNGCTFSPLIITNPINAYTVNKFNCNEVINKDVFTEQPYVYFSNAEEVFFCATTEENLCVTFSNYRIRVILFLCWIRTHLSIMQVNFIFTGLLPMFR